MRAAAASAPRSATQCIAQGQIAQAANDDQNYTIQQGDELAVDFYLNPEFNDNVSVRPDGKISLRLIGGVQAAGLTPGELAQRINTAYQSELRSPGATVHVKGMPGRQIYVQGQVTKPGSVVMQPGMTVLQAIAAAGGLTPEAADKVILIRRDACGTSQGSEINVKQAMDHPDGGEDVALAPRDVLVAPRSTISNLDLFVQQYIRGLLPVEPSAAAYLPL